MKLKIDIISGFLGAGKTTLIKKLLEENVFDEKIVIIENEYGEVGIDGALLSDQSIEVKELTSGCICCSLRRDFLASIDEVVNTFNPSRILVEPSGVATVDVITAAEKYANLDENRMLNMRIFVLDVLKYEFTSSYFGDFFINQVKNAKTIVFSRTQNAGSEITAKVMQAVKEINPSASILTTPWDELTAEQIVSLAEQHNTIKEMYLIENDVAVSTKGVKFENWGTQTLKIYSEDELRKILESFDDREKYGFIVRGKGILPVDSEKWVQFDYTLGEIEIKDSYSSTSGMISVIGTDLNKNKLMNTFTN